MAWVRGEQVSFNQPIFYLWTESVTGERQIRMHNDPPTNDAPPGHFEGWYE